jgi:uncharacterized protein YutE (UPF0331/DUF86 family)
MTAFSVPAFARLSPKIARAERELQQIETYYDGHSDQVSDGDWGALSAVSLGIHNVYNGIEDILLSIARDIDGAVPTGATMHQDILDQMAADVAGTRPALFGEVLYESLTELKGFRHLVRHRYGFDLKADKVIENLQRLQNVFPGFLDSVVQLERTMAESSDT